MMKLFFSHKTDELKFFQIDVIAQKLKEHPDIEEVYIWEKDVAGNIMAFMEEKIQQSAIFVLFCSPAIAKSIPVQNEWQTAIRLNKQIIPIFCDADDIPGLLQNERGFLFDEDNLDQFVKELYEYIQKLYPKAIIEAEKKFRENLKKIFDSMMQAKQKKQRIIMDVQRLHSFYERHFSRLDNFSKVKIREIVQSMVEEAEKDCHIDKILNDLAAIYEKLGDFTTVLRIYNTQIQQQPSSYNFWKRKINFLQNQNSFDEAIKTCENAINYLPNNANILLDLAIIYEKRENISKAESYYKKILEIDPTNLEAAQNLARLYEITANQEYIEFSKKLQAIKKTNEMKENEEWADLEKDEVEEEEEFIDEDDLEQEPEFIEHQETEFDIIDKNIIAARNISLETLRELKTLLLKVPKNELKWFLEAKKGGKSGNKSQLIQNVFQADASFDEILEIPNKSILDQFSRDKGLPIQPEKSQLIDQILNLYQLTVQYDEKEVEEEIVEDHTQMNSDFIWLGENLRFILSFLKKNSLQEIASQVKVAKSGKKPEIISRIIEYGISPKNLLPNSAFKTICRSFNLPSTGIKMELIQTIKNYIETSINE